MKTAPPSPTRRQFLGQAIASAAAFSIVPRHVLGGPKFVPPSDKVNVAIVGAGGQARFSMSSLFQQPDAQIIAVADPAESYQDDFFYRTPVGRASFQAEIEKHYAGQTPSSRCAAYEDYRVMFEKESAIDAVVCATPDHLHACVSIAAMRLGKHVYCEKPLCHNLWEARKVAQVAKETGVATQMGNQLHSTEGMRQTVEWLRADAIGPVREVHAWVGASRWNKTLTGRPSDLPPVPAGLNWDLWLGPREDRPYHPAYFPVRWRDFWAFGLGGLGDFGCHDLDAACWALDLRDPLSVECRPAGQMDAEISPHGEICYYEFGPRGDLPPVRVTWYDGGLRPPLPVDWPQDQEFPGRGSLFIGDKGVLICPGAGAPPRLLPESKMAEFQPPPATLPRSKGHHRDWLDACKGGPAASSHFEYGAQLTELPLLGILSLRTGRKIDWDAGNLQAKGIPDATPIIKESYRTGWEIA